MYLDYEALKEVLVANEPVEVVSGIERWSDLEFSDGSRFRVKLNIVSGCRIDGQYDASGNPVYHFVTIPSFASIFVPEKFRKPTG